MVTTIGHAQLEIAFTMDTLTDKMEKIDFHHPYMPYDVQKEFMSTAYHVLKQGNGQVGILESPTGTGKSLSLICAALTWLRNHKRETFDVSIEDAVNGFTDEPDWIVQQMLKRKRDELTSAWTEREARLESIRAREKAFEARGAKRRKMQEDSAGGHHEPTEDDEWLLADNTADSQEDAGGPGFSKETQALMAKLGMGPLKSQNDEEAADTNEIKIYYTSRTHSQLTQFVGELRRPNFPSSLPDSIREQKTEGDAEGVKHLPLSSRQRLCINPSVSRLGSLAAINDRCSELQQSKSTTKCSFVPGADNLKNTHQFRDNVLATLPDIEDLFALGKKFQVCPYYASRTAIPSAEIVTLPYPLLLQQTAREALGIKLEGNVVIIDEAHNIMDAVSNVYAAEISLSDLKRARQMLGVYVKKFGKKLKGENRVMVAQLARVVDGLSAWLDDAIQLKTDQGIVDPNALLKTKGADQINLYQLIQYVQTSKLAYKVEGYVAQAESGEGVPIKSSSTPVLHTLVSFLISLNNPSSEGRIFYHKDIRDIKLSYLLLSPTHAFSSIANSARAVILAGGTMSPFDDYTAHLFPELPKTKVTTLSCGHVIPSSNLCVWTLASTKPASDSSGVPFEFSFQRRGDKAMVRELGLAILNICTIVPDGVVVFFPSYGYLDEVVAAWSNRGPGEPKSIWERLQAKKEVFSEPKGGSIDEVLDKYTKAILGEGDETKPPSKSLSSLGSGSSTRPQQPKTTNGALLLSVVGGKMSEGINFSDRLGRCVVIVGLPYPNINSPDWKARIEYIESTTLKRLTTPAAETEGGDLGAGRQPAMPRNEALAVAKQASRDFYENACMRAVNQSIGRAIRHKDDYASIVLVDRRYGTPRIRGKLPGWIQGGLVEGSERGGLGQMMGKLSGFFRGKKT
ncbi:DEAD-2 domain-containing protein [Microdochium trichocladiopsis]|uniref:ATP-dependent DNA helicase CHL1 n=1 Tax=Microdochium trichocladiopsis TaxID=1682393 RepID=A0A9P8XTN7_9PEZI|nr:DEAD-2 domain-containing protein [Microdochium trichocladiopsis]KAH7018140.1 DEAD-2 domain-containing protein [Microdochium trichocladiopsis]